MFSAFVDPFWPHSQTQQRSEVTSSAAPGRFHCRPSDYSGRFTRWTRSLKGRVSRQRCRLENRCPEAPNHMHRQCEANHHWWFLFWKSRVRMLSPRLGATTDAWALGRGGCEEGSPSTLSPQDSSSSRYAFLGSSYESRSQRLRSDLIEGFGTSFWLHVTFFFCAVFFTLLLVWSVFLKLICLSHPSPKHNSTLNSILKKLKPN